MAATLQLLQKAEGRWEPDGGSLRFEDDTKDLAWDKATRYGERWVSNDRANRQYRIYT